MIFSVVFVEAHSCKENSVIGLDHCLHLYSNTSTGDSGRVCAASGIHCNESHSFLYLVHKMISYR